MGAMWPRAKKLLRPPEAGRGQERPSLEPGRGHGPAHPDYGLQHWGRALFYSKLPSLCASLRQAQEPNIPTLPLGSRAGHVLPVQPIILGLGTRP